MAVGLVAWLAALSSLCATHSFTLPRRSTSLFSVAPHVCVLYNIVQCTGVMSTTLPAKQSVLLVIIPAYTDCTFVMRSTDPEDDADAET